ncbi:hypothetical protein BST27_15650 [Mycobacterium intermedium]|uniref:Uncharacterized protein n=1 Tax=Mycobacterium intermedium TaxID=28445 RepID=A0A1E3S895_MYCIE|nr:hypothetical protein [Mycobacterium intermedium]MCV6964210.1 hypothetical protein [Mycobacterium intermedium]ODQ98291.1 hypothetical protein BHQ20_22590 [Mycobacterium intermedium]OPE48669.1 hypothetical protein BV508_17095 [Mycobacterium intermedium]ORB03385.1 hypothetical protein BST27_15650 [Mycobacterium intermedium]
MTVSQPEIRRFRIRSHANADQHAMLQRAEERARSEVAANEEAFDVHVDDVVHMKATDLWYFSFQVIKPGDARNARPQTLPH